MGNLLLLLKWDQEVSVAIQSSYWMEKPFLYEANLSFLSTEPWATTFPLSLIHVLIFYKCLFVFYISSYSSFHLYICVLITKFSCCVMKKKSCKNSLAEKVRGETKTKLYLLQKQRSDMRDDLCIIYVVSLEQQNLNI